MTVKLELTPDVEAGLVAQAQARGLSLEEYLQQVLRERSVATVTPVDGREEKARAFLAFVRGHRHTPALSEDAVRRENLVRDAQ